MSSCSPTFSTGPSPSLRIRDRADGLIYVTDSTGPGRPCCHINRELEFSVDTSGNVKPARRIAGTATKLFNPQYQAIDAAGYLYVVNTLIAGEKGRPNVVVFAPGADRNVPPVRTLTMDQDLFPYPFQVALDTDGYLYEADQARARIDVYAPGAHGHVKPVRTIRGTRTGLTTPFGIALDQEADIFVGCAIGSTSSSAKILEFPPGSRGDVAPSRKITGPNTLLFAPGEMSVSSLGELYVSDDRDTNGRILVFAPGASGNAQPVRSIIEPQNVFSNGVALFKDELFVAETNNISLERISVYPAHFKGNPPAIRVIQGDKTGMHYPATPIVP